MSKKLKIGLVAGVVVLAGVLFAGWYFIVRDTSEPEASVDAIETDTTAAGGSTSAPAAAASTPDGEYTVQEGKTVFVGYRVRELFAGDTIKKTATGRTGDVTGSMTITGKSVPNVEVTADVTTLESDQSRRDMAIRTRGLQTEQFPQANFKLTAPVTLPSVAKDETVKTTATGDLTLHGVTKPVEVELEAKWNGSSVSVAGSTPIVFADYDIDTVEIPGFVKTDDNGVLELQLLFVPK